MSESGDLVESRNGTLHLSTGEVVFTEHGERTKMRCGATLPGIGLPYDKFMVADARRDGDLCDRCFDDEAVPGGASA